LVWRVKSGPISIIYLAGRQIAPCPCGSGKKFKACHYADLRAKGVI
jgi:hypothetical protein